MSSSYEVTRPNRENTKSARAKASTKRRQSITVVHERKNSRTSVDVPLDAIEKLQPWLPLILSALLAWLLLAPH